MRGFGHLMDRLFGGGGSDGKNEYPEWVYFWTHTPREGDEWQSHVFSNWFPSTFRDPDNGLTYHNVEQYMMAQKARLFGDRDSEAAIMKTADPKVIKALGRGVKGFSDTTWGARDYGIVLRANRYKYGQNPDLLRLLLQTQGYGLAEASPHDYKWGIGMGAEQASRTPPHKWPGKNLLGKALMEVREELLQTENAAGQQAHHHQQHQQPEQQHHRPQPQHNRQQQRHYPPHQPQHRQGQGYEGNQHRQPRHHSPHSPHGGTHSPHNDPHSPGNHQGGYRQGGNSTTWHNQRQSGYDRHHQSQAKY